MNSGLFISTLISLCGAPPAGEATRVDAVDAQDASDAADAADAALQDPSRKVEKSGDEAKSHAKLEKSRLAVMALAPEGVPEEFAAGVTETIATATSQTEVFETISPQQVASVLAYEKRKELLGACAKEQCYVQIAQMLRAPHLIAGSVATVGGRLTLNLVLIDASAGRALKRTSRDTDNPSELLREARHAAIVLLQPVLRERSGYLKTEVNVPDAQISINDELRAEGPGQVIALAAGPHVLSVKHDGFYAATQDVFVRPNQVATEDIKLVPAKETIEDYESKATFMRVGAYGTGVLAIGAAVASAFFYAQATDDKDIVNGYATATSVDRLSLSRGEAVDAEGSFGTNQALYLTFLGTAIASAGVSLYLFIAGDDPDRYEEFRTITGE